jgi:hypothetical protein
MDGDYDYVLAQRRQRADARANSAVPTSASTSATQDVSTSNPRPDIEDILPAEQDCPEVGSAAKETHLRTPRKYRRRVSAEYSARLEKAKQYYEKNKDCSSVSLRKVALKFDVARTSLFNHRMNPDAKKPGRGTLISDEEDEQIVKLMMLVGSWGFPLSFSKLAYVVENFLKKKHQRKIEMFEGLLENQPDMEARTEIEKLRPQPYFGCPNAPGGRHHRPGRRWMRSFLLRHSEVSLRLCQSKRMNEMKVGKKKIRRYGIVDFIPLHVKN